MTFLIDTHQKDQQYAFDLAAYLTRQGIDIEFNQESHDPNISLARFDTVSSVRNLIIIFGKVGNDWLVGRIKKVFKTISEQFDVEEAPNLENIWIYLTPTSGGRLNLPKYASYKY